MNVIKDAHLFMRAGTSDKEYHAELKESGGKYRVDFSYGRRGAALQSDSKVIDVALAEAEKVFDRLVREKLAKGYKPGAGGTSYVPPTQAAVVATGNCQLLNPILNKDAHKYVNDSTYVAQEKFDGHRVMLVAGGGKVLGLNRLGKPRGVPKVLHDAVLALVPANSRLGYLHLDGELVGERYYAFDLLALNGDVVAEPYDRRLALLEKLPLTGPVIQHVTTARTEKDKAAMVVVLVDQGREGVVFKDRTAPYAAGRPANGGPQVKLKFYETATVRVEAITKGKRSVRLEALNHKGWIGIGGCTIPPNQDVPPVGARVEVRYLYYFDGGGLFQPTYLGDRSDEMGDSDCTVSQLKVKS